LFSVPPDAAADGRIDELQKQLDGLLARYAKDKKMSDAMMAKLDKTPLGVAILGSTLGAASANSSQQNIEDENRRLKKQLANPIFSRFYFTAQRLHRNRVHRSRAI
jgi:hypothetical protein